MPKEEHINFRRTKIYIFALEIELEQNSEILIFFVINF